MTYTPILPDPTEEHENGKKCSNWYCNKVLDCNDFYDICNTCHNEPEEVAENNDDNGYCNDCFFSCCGDELDQDIRICPTCKEHN